MVGEFRRQHPEDFARLGQPRQRPLDHWDVLLQSGDLKRPELEAEAGNLSTALQNFEKNSVTWAYTYHSHSPTAVSYVTSCFLHGGWEHIFFNMWFLWLAGTILEDTWGRVVYPIFYLLCGIVATVVQGAVFPDSFVQCLGASGAIAGLMGAFLARFPAVRIKMTWVWTFLLLTLVSKAESAAAQTGLTSGGKKDGQANKYRAYFFVPAYVLLPLWLFIEVFWGAMATAGLEQGVAHWAHIGGFAFGMLGAVILRVSGLEQAADEAIEAKVSWTADPRIVRATEFVEAQQFDGAIAEMQQLVKEQPDSIEGHELLLRAQERKEDVEGQRQTLAALCRVHVAAGHGETAWRYYEQFQNLGGDRLPRGVWLALCRYLEDDHAWAVAVEEYKRFAEVNAKERASVSALISAAQISLLHLRKREEALALYLAAADSPVKHDDLDSTIQAGIKQCAAAESKVGTYTARNAQQTLAPAGTNQEKT